jgi:hypothetical protein
MMLNEDDEETRVTFQTYKKFFRYAGVVRALVCPAIVLILFTFVTVVADYVVGAWATAED